MVYNSTVQSWSGRRGLNSHGAFCLRERRPSGSQGHRVCQFRHARIVGSVSGWPVLQTYLPADRIFIEPPSVLPLLRASDSTYHDVQSHRPVLSVVSTPSKGRYDLSSATRPPSRFHWESFQPDVL